VFISETSVTIPMPSSILLILSIIAAIIPTLFFIALIYWVDRYEKEPFWLLGSAFLWGAIPSIIFAYIFNSVLSIPFYLISNGVGDLLSGVLIAPPIEESIKGAALLGILLLWRHEIDSPLDGIIYGAMVGMGFAMVENVYYFVNVFNEGGTAAWGMNIFFRAFIFGLNHALFTSITGLSIAISRLSTNDFVKIAAPIGGWITAVFLHSLHNLTVSFDNLLCFFALLFDWGGVLLVVAIIVGALAQEQRWLVKYLREDVENGILPAQLYVNACSNKKRGAHKWQVLVGETAVYSKTLRFYQQCSKLAYKKHHYTLFQHEKDAQRIVALQNELFYLGKEVAEKTL
jgi:RsiW-degrading membrane proteinase PrsW (M82 family)